MAICPNPDDSLCSQKTVKFIFLLQLHHSWLASLYPKALDTLSHSTKKSKRKAYWPTNPWLWVFTIQELALSNRFPFLPDLSRSSKLSLSPLQLLVQPSLLSWAPPWNTKIQLSLPLQKVLPLLWPKLWGLQPAYFQETTISRVPNKDLVSPSTWNQPLQLLPPSQRGILKGNLAYHLFSLTLLGEGCRWLFSAVKVTPPLRDLVDITGNFFTARLSNHHSLSCDWAVFTHQSKAIYGLGKS